MEFRRVLFRSASCAGGRRARSLVCRSQGRYRGTVENLPVRRELGAMTRAVPAFLEAVPVHQAAEMRADGGTADDGAVLTFAGGDLSHPFAHDGSLAGREVVRRFAVAGPQMFAAIPQIGRGSCGERVCQYV